jgi:hypothetical protein
MAKKNPPKRVYTVYLLRRGGFVMATPSGHLNLVTLA